MRKIIDMIETDEQMFAVSYALGALLLLITEPRLFIESPIAFLLISIPLFLLGALCIFVVDLLIASRDLFSYFFRRLKKTS